MGEYFCESMNQREKFVSKCVSKSGINTRFYVLFGRYNWYGYPSCTTPGEV
jgi:hypothetical protein